MTVIQPLQMVLENPGMELPVTGLIQTCARKVRMDVQVECRAVQTQQAALWIYAMELTTTAILLQQMVQERPGTALPVMEQIRTFVTKELIPVQVAHRAVQTIQAIT